MMQYELTVWPLVAGHGGGDRRPAEVACLPDVTEPLPGGEPVVVLDLKQHELLAMATSDREPLGFEAPSDDPAAVREAALAALNAVTQADYDFNPGLAEHRCTPFGCIPGLAPGSYVHLITHDGVAVGDTASRAGAAHVVLRYAASISPSL